MQREPRRRLCFLTIVEMGKAGEPVEVVESESAELPMCPKCGTLEHVSAVVLPRCNNRAVHGDGERAKTEDPPTEERAREMLGFLSRADIDARRAKTAAAAEGEQP